MELHGITLIAKTQTEYDNPKHTLQTERNIRFDRISYLYYSSKFIYDERMERHADSSLFTSLTNRQYPFSYTPVALPAFGSFTSTTTNLLCLMNSSQLKHSPNIAIWCIRLILQCHDKAIVITKRHPKYSIAFFDIFSEIRCIKRSTCQLAWSATCSPLFLPKMYCSKSCSHMWSQIPLWPLQPVCNLRRQNVGFPVNHSNSWHKTLPWRGSWCVHIWVEWLVWPDRR